MCTLLRRSRRRFRRTVDGEVWNSTVPIETLLCISILGGNAVALESEARLLRSCTAMSWPALMSVPDKSLCSCQLHRPRLPGPAHLLSLSTGGIWIKPNSVRTCFRTLHAGKLCEAGFATVGDEWWSLFGGGGAVACSGPSHPLSPPYPR